MWGALVVGVPSRSRAGTLDGVLLAGARAGAAGGVRAGHRPADGDADAPARAPLRRADARGDRRAARRSPSPPIRAPLPTGTPAALQAVRGSAQSATASPGRGRSTGSTSTCAPAGRVALVGRSGAGKSTLADVLLRFLPYQAGSVALDGVEIADLDGDDVPPGGRPGLARTRTSSTPRSRRTCASPGETRLPAELRRSSARRSPAGVGRTGCPTAWPPRSGERGARSPAGSGSASRSPARCSRTSRCWSSTSPASTSTRHRRRARGRPAGRHRGSGDAADHPPARRTEERRSR